MVHGNGKHKKNDLTTRIIIALSNRFVASNLYSA